MSVSGNREYFNLKPINNTSSGFGHNTGLPTIKFSLSNQDKVIESIRLIGKIECYDGTTDAIHTTADGFNYYVLKKAGVQGIFKTATISSKVSPRVIERVNNIHRLVPQLKNSMNNQEDLDCDMMEWSMNNSLVANRLTFEGQQFSIRIPCGLLNSRASVVDLSPQGFNGLDISLEMNTDAVIFAGTNAGARKPYIKLKDVQLVGTWITPSESRRQRIRAIPYKTFSSYFNVLNSSNETINTTLGLSSVVGFFANFLATNRANSYSYDADDLTQLDNLNRVSYGKAGRMRPNSFRVRPVPLPDNEGTQNQIARQLNSAFEPYNDIKHSNINLQSQVLGTNGENMGVGCRFTTSSGKGEGFVNSVFSINLESDLGTAGADPTGMYSFYINQNVVAPTPRGVVVAN